MIQIRKGSTKNKTAQGIHLLRPTPHELSDAISTAERDGFQSIYVHGVQSPLSNVEVCPFCSGLNCYSPLDIDGKLGIVRYSCTSCFDWQCGHCEQYFSLADSPALEYGHR